MSAAGRAPRPPFPGPVVGVCRSSLCCIQGPVSLPVPPLARAAAGDGAGGRERPLKGRCRWHVGPEHRRFGPHGALGHPHRTMQDLSTASSICSREKSGDSLTGLVSVLEGTASLLKRRAIDEGPDSTTCGSLLPGTLPKHRMRTTRPVPGSSTLSELSSVLQVHLQGQGGAAHTESPPKGQYTDGQILPSLQAGSHFRRARPSLCMPAGDAHREDPFSRKSRPRGYGWVGT